MVWNMNALIVENGMCEVWLTVWEPDHLKGRLDGRGQLIAPLEWGRASLWGVINGVVSASQADQMVGSANSSFVLG